ncbi:MAG TPA: leucyl/phenylalanyl-tRNA--protein transferase [Thermodesulfobacteriota bacterium]
MSIFLLDNSLAFPHPRYAERDGLLAIGGDLRVERLLLAYRNGIFPWFSEGNPILWFSPDPRLVLVPDQFKISASLRKVIRSNTFEVRFDTRFDEVIVQCAKSARKNQYGTWITSDMIEAYIRLHREGYAHSVETIQEDRLVGGLYGVSLGGAFFGESMFHIMSNASKVALYYLAERLRSWDFDFLDSQVPTDHMKSLGSREVDRESFLNMLGETLKKRTMKGKWTES